MINILIGAGGAAIVLAVAFDVFRSLLVPRASGRMLRVAPALNSIFFANWQATAGRIALPRRGQAMRASFAPLMLILTLMIWTALLIFGFGLLFWADRGSFQPAFSNLGEAVYGAGSAFSTLGVNRTVEGNLSRLTVLVCSITGLAIVTVVATFLISIQSGFGRRETLVLRLESHVTLPPAGIAILETYAGERIVERLGPFFEAWELWAAEVAISHRAFPILIFFRSNDSRCEWLAAFGAVMDAAALLDATVADASPTARAGAHFVLRTGARMLAEMARQLGAPEEFTVAAADHDRFHQHRQRLAEAGYGLVKDEKSSFDNFEHVRASYAGALATLGRHLYIDVDERTGADLDSEPKR